MSNASDFIIENGVLKKYVGPGGDVVIPEGVTRIGYYAFKHAKIKCVSMPEGVAEIEDHAFFWCDTLEKVVLPSTVVEIYPDGVFQNCTGLKEIEAPNVVFEKAWKHLSTKQRLSICEHTIKSKRQLRAAELKTAEKSNGLIKSAIEQDDDAYLVAALGFKSTLPCDAIDEFLELSKNSPKAKLILIDYKNKHYSPETIADLESSRIELELGFRERTNEEWRGVLTLKNSGEGWILSSWRGDDEIVMLPCELDGKPIIAISEAAFSPLQKNTEAVKQGRINMRKIVIPEGVRSIGTCDSPRATGSFLNCTGLEEVVLPESLVEVGSRTFSGCVNLKEIYIPKNIKKIGIAAFPDNIADITIDKANATFATKDGILYDKKKGILVCAFGEHIFIDEDIQAVREDAFRHRERVKKIVFASDFVKLEKYIFQGCTSLKEVVLPTGLVQIPPFAFEDCKALESIHLPDSVEKIGESAFSRCSSLKEIHISGSVTSIRNDAFHRYGKVMRNVTIFAPAGSYAETYARKNKIPFVVE